MKILHVLYQSIPNKQGTSIRTRDILRSQKDAGMEVVAITSPMQEASVPGADVEYIDEIKIYRTHPKGSTLSISDKPATIYVRLKKILRIFSFTITVCRVARKEKVDIIHAHATFFVGIAGKIASFWIKKPFIYEVRSLWEEGARVDKPSPFQRLQMKVIVFFENLVCNSARTVISINEGLKDKLIGRGVTRQIKVIPNAFYFGENTRKETINWKPGTSLKLGFVGSINYYEGLELIIHAAERLPDFQFLLWGNGPDRDDFVQRISQIKNIKYNGIINPEQIKLAYDQVDVIVNPRFGSNLTNNVTPLKPIEAMGYGKLVIASNIGGMREIITHMETGLLFADRNLDDFVKNITWASAPENREKIVPMLLSAWEYVHEKRNWLHNGYAYLNIYSN